MKKNKIYFILIIITIFSFYFHNTPAYSEEDDLNEDPFGEKNASFKISGQYRNLFTYTGTDSFIGDDPATTKKKNLMADLNRIRLTPEFNYGESIFIHVDFDNELITGNYNKSYEFDNYWRDSGYNDLLDLAWEPHYDKNIYYRAKIHRAYTKIVINDFTFTLGRQQIRFGSGRLWNPLDIMNPISPTFVEGAEEQKGTDAIKIDYYFSDTTEFTVASAQKRHNNNLSELNLKDSNTITRLKFTIHDTDFAILTGFVSRRTTGGVDISTVFLEGMLRGSILYSKPEDEHYFITGSAGYEYTFKNGLYFLTEYFYNENGLNYNDSLKTVYIQYLYEGINQDNYNQLSNRIITYNRHYLGFALGYDFHPLIRGDLFTIYDFQGQGLFVNFSLKYNIFENVDLMAGVITGYVFDNGEKTSDFLEFNRHNFYFASLIVYL